MFANRSRFHCLTYSVRNRFDKVVDIVLIEDNISMFGCRCRRFVYSMIIEVKDFHVNYTEGNSLWKQWRYQGEFWSELAVSMALEIEKSDSSLSARTRKLLMIIVWITHSISSYWGGGEEEEEREEREKKDADRMMVRITVFCIHLLTHKASSLAK